MAKLLDTNLIVHFLLNDPPQQADVVEKLLKKSQEVLILPNIVVAEIIYVLHSNYKFSKEEIIEKVYDFIQTSTIICNRELIFNSLINYLNHNISFVDAYLAAYTQLEKLEGIYSFDEGLDKVKSIKRFKP